MRKIIALGIGILLLPYFALAAADDFTISVLAGDDTTPPSTPTLLIVTPVAPTQIDVSWSVSTDNFLLSGYVLLRDGLPIATTTLTSYNDTGLLPETLYGYEVYAFDSSLNISATSSLISTTTPAVVVVATSTSETESTGPDATLTTVLKDLVITPFINQVTIAWKTNIPTRYALRWGRTSSYNGGYVLNETYLAAHKTTISDLEPGTKYYYELISYTPKGIAVVLSRGNFSTEAALRPSFVENVQRLEALVEDDDVLLSWKNPLSLEDFTVRVVRSHLGFPIDKNDGAIIYEGEGSFMRDQKALSFYKKQYYTVFVIAKDGTISSGAVVVAEARGEVGENKDENWATSSSGTSTNNVLPDLPIFGLDLANIIVQQREEFSFSAERIALLYNEPFTIRIPLQALPDNLKSIIVTLLDPTDQRRSYSFLLRINKTGTAYEATVAPLSVMGSSRLQIEVFDFERMLMGRYRKSIDFIEEPLQVKPVFFPDTLLLVAAKALPVLASLLLIIAGTILFFLVWRRKNKRAEDKL